MKAPDTPPGLLYPWADSDHPAAFRAYDGKRWSVDRRRDRKREYDIEVYVAGLQHADGRVEREVVVDQLTYREPITASQARQLARVLIAAADAADCDDHWR